jgi:uroporphyrin-III C-methyltransferase
MVHLLGAGPGDPDLITVKALRILQRADVVLYDRLANPALLKETPPHALLIDVGKAPRDPWQTRQEHINALLVEYGKTGKTVVRLKGGDPFVFGRGSEECEALEEAGLPHEVVPGISSCIAAPASAGIPVTHRGVANAFAVFSGHEAKDKEEDGIVWEAAVLIPTAVFLMGVEKLPYIVSKLVEHGRSPETPVAIVSKGTLTSQQSVLGTLADITEKAAGIPSPATIVVGEVALMHKSAAGTAQEQVAFEVLQAA